MHEFFFNLGGGGKALAADWYVVSGDTGNQIKYYQASTPYNVNNWSSANSSTNTANDLNTFLNNTVQDGDTVYIASGDYKLSAQIDLTSKALKLYGGFAGTETSSSDRKLDVNVTSLDAQIGFVDGATDRRRVLDISTDSTVDGFTIMRGYRDETGEGDEKGGGIRITGGNPIITNCTITRNRSHYNDGGGGGVYIKDGAPTLINCTITSNDANTGNGIRVAGGTSKIINCTITDNSGGNVGSIYVTGGTLTITNCTISDNSGNKGGGVYIKDGTLTIINCTIVNNRAANGNGHEIYREGGTVTLKNTLVWNADTDKAISGDMSFDHCAYPGSTTVNTSEWTSLASSNDVINGVKHTVYLAKDNLVLYSLAGKGVSDSTTPTDDQLRKTRANPPSIGAVEFASVWYVVKGESDNEIKYFQATTTEYAQSNWASANTGTTSTDLNTFLNSGSVSNGDTVYIASGDYKLSAQIDLTSKALKLYGGFAGTENSSSDRKLNVNITSLDAQIGFVDGATGGPRRVLDISTDSTVDGFTIMRGHYNDEGGGGIRITGANPIIINCTITRNRSHNGNGGGGVYIAGGTPEIINCAIISNDGNPCGGVRVAGGTSKITNCTITDNKNTGHIGGGGFYITDGTLTITNCTISDNASAGNNHDKGGGVYITGGTLTGTNCTIVNNRATDNNGHEIYREDGTVTLKNTLVWNVSTDKAISGDITYNYCAYPNANATVNTSEWTSLASSNDVINGVKHTVYLAENNLVLYALAGKGVSDDTTPTDDQLRKTRANPPSIGAAEYDPPVLSVDISGDSEISTSYGTAKTLTFIPTVSLDNVALTTGYTVSWDVAVNPTASAISIDQSGKLTVGSTTPVGTYEATVKAQATYLDVIKSGIAEKAVTVTVESGDITLTLTSKDLPAGKVNTAYAEEQYFTATATPSSADITWSVEGLPAGLSFNKGTISGTPTASGDFSVKVTVTATLANYYDASKDITASLVIEKAAEENPEEEQGGKEQEEQEDDSTTVISSGDISNIPDTQKKTMTNLVLTDLTAGSSLSEILLQITSDKFQSLTNVEISSNVEVDNGGALDLGTLPATITNFSISGNVSLKTLNLKASKVANIDASNCTKLESIDVSGNENIVSLDVSSTGIKTLDASNCTKLKYLDCSAGVLYSLNIEGCALLENVICNGNALLVLDIPSGLSNLKSVDCASQDFGNWSSVVSLNFDEFVRSPDVASSSDNTTSASSVAYLPAGMVRVSATKLSNVENLKAYNKSGDIIPVIASDDKGNITFASAPDIMTYDYNIGFNNTSMDVTVYASNGNSNNTLSGSGGGCSLIRNEGLGIRNVLILLLLFVLAPLKIKKI